jgi:hypothetical protein
MQTELKRVLGKVVWQLAIPRPTTLPKTELLAWPEQLPCQNAAGSQCGE